VDTESSHVGTDHVAALSNTMCGPCKEKSSLPALAPTTDLIKYNFSLAKGAAGVHQLRIRVYTDGGTYPLFERDNEEVDKSRTYGIYPIRSLPEFRVFLEHDEHYGRFRDEYERIYDTVASVYSEMDTSSLEEMSFEGDPIKALKGIRSIRSESTLIETVLKWIRIFGAEYFTYARIIRDHQDPQIENRSWLLGYPAAYAQIYHARRWYENDPYIARARTTDEPFCGHETPTMTEGQALLRAAGHKYGINALMSIPVHGHNKAHIGLLYVALNTERMSGERMLQEYKIHFQMLAREIHNWWGERARLAAVHKYALDELEIGVLKLVQSDVGLAAEQALELGVPAAKIYKVNQSIKKKFETNDLAVAARIASVHELI
jgi:hypothetical protein